MPPVLLHFFDSQNLDCPLVLDFDSRIYRYSIWRLLTKAVGHGLDIGPQGAVIYITLVPERDGDIFLNSG